MNEVVTALNSLSNDNACNSVLITAENDIFCSGLDYEMLVQATADRRRVEAAQLSTSVR